MNEQIWVVISCEIVYSKLRELVDAGEYEQASQLQYALMALMEKIKSLVQSRGGSLLLNMYDRQVLMMSSSVAEDLPNILAGYQEIFGKNMAVGIGLDLKEASWAVKQSKGSGEIEFYAPDKITMDIPEITKDEIKPGPRGAVDFSAILPPNLFDPLLPEPKKQGEEPSYKRTSIEQDMQGEDKLLQGMIQILGGGQVEQQMQQMQQQIEQQQNQPRNLLESLHGERLPNQEPQQEAQPKSKPEEAKKDEMPENAPKEEPKEDETTKLGTLMTQVKEFLPQIMGLSQSNPEAFKHSMNVVNKIIKLAKLNRETKKAEHWQEFQELKKAFEDIQKSKSWKPQFKKPHIDYPLGTILGNKKLVTVNGRKTWRQMASGQVMDEQGQAISVKQSNAQTENDQSGK